MPNFKKDGIRVNCLCPFFCDTEIVRESRKNFSKEHLEFYKSLGMVK